MIRKQKKILLIYRDYLSYNRGTPIRVKSLLKQISREDSFEIYTASRDEYLLDGAIHLKLSSDNFKNIKKLSYFIRENNIDIVVFHTMASAYYMLPLMMLGGKFKRVLEMHGFLEEEARLYNSISLFKYHRNKFIYSVVYKMCNLITTCSDTATKKILKFNKNTKTIYGAVDLKKFNSEYLSKKNKLKNSGNIIIGYSGNGRKWQGVDFLLEAFCVLKKRDPDYQLHLLLSEYVDVGSIPDVFVYKPVNHDNVAEFNGQCDILVIPRLDNIVNELSFPSKLMEYLAMGLPVVGSRTSDMHKIVKHKENGMLYKPGDINEFVGCLQELKDSNLRKKIGLNAENLVKTKYSWDTQGALFIDLIKKL